MPGPWDPPQNEEPRRRLADDLDELERINPLVSRPLNAADIILFLLWAALVITPFGAVWLVHH